MPSTVTFDAGSTGSATVYGPPSGTTADGKPRYVQGRTADGTAIVYKLPTAVRDVWTLDLSSLPASQRDALAAFFAAVEGPAGTFDYTHTDGTTYTACRFADAALRWTRENAALWGVTVRLDVPGGVTN